MFDNIERKLKGFAKFNLIGSFIVAGMLFLLCLVDEEYHSVWFFVPILVLGGFTFSWPIYALAEMVEGIKENNKTLKYIFQDDIRRYQGIEYEQETQKRKIEQDRAEAIRQREREQQEADRLVKKQREDRIAAYWKEHEEEKEALLKKKAEAEVRLSELSGLAKKERKIIEVLIEQINYELTKDR